MHLLFWGALLLIDVLMVYTAPASAKTELLSQRLVGRLVLTDLLAALLFYSNWLVLIPRTLGRGRLGAYIVGTLVLLALYVPARFVVSLLVGGAAEDVHSRSHAVQMIVPYGIMGLMAIFLSSALRITRDYLQAQHNRQELERQQLLTELALLRTQLNPHFLFNTLNNIYTLTKRKSDRAPEAVLRLAGIMRYLLYDSRPEAVPLHQELTHLGSYLDLQRLRLPVSATEIVVVDTEGIAEEESFRVAPLLLLPLLENAFKHGDLAARPVAVHLRLSLTVARHLRVEIRNAVAPADATRSLPDTTGGVGLANLRRRLQLLYPGRHQLHVQAAATEHTVILELHGELHSEFAPAEERPAV